MNGKCASAGPLPAKMWQRPDAVKKQTEKGGTEYAAYRDFHVSGTESGD